MLSRCLIIVLLGLLAARPAGAEPAVAVEPVEQVKFEHEKALAHMRELEQRMYRLAELIREDQPDDAARLLMAVSRAREQLITEQMDEITRLLSALELAPAGDQQLEVIQKLEQLKQLLLSADLDLELRLQQLRKLREARERLERLLDRERKQRELTRALSEQTPEQPFEQLQDNERRNQKGAEGVQSLLEQVGSEASAAAASVGRAGAAMGDAAQRLDQSAADAAAQAQGKAIRNLEEALEQVKQAEQKLLEEMEPLVRQRIMDNLSEMLSRQIKVREATVDLSQQRADHERQARLALQRLARDEDDIAVLAAQTVDLARETGFSVTLPPALEVVQTRMVHVSDDLRTGRGGPSVIADQRRIEAELQALLEAMEDTSKPGQQANQSGQCRGCQGDLNKLLAEVKMLRLLQVAVNDQTVEADALRRDHPNKQAQADRIAQTLRDREDEIRQATDELNRRYGR